MKPNFRKDFPNHFKLPERISRLEDLAYNLWWAWNPDGMRLFLQLDRQLWEKINHNPIALIHQIDPQRVSDAEKDTYYLKEYDRVLAKFDAYMDSEKTWYDTNYPELKDHQMAYFSFEFGLHESMPFYAGGLGILSGDHLKEASDLGMPLVGVGFIYKQGYFVQNITEDGWQETSYYHFDFKEMPIISIVDDNGNPITVAVDLPGRLVKARVWMIQVGRIPLFLMDTSISENETNDRTLTSRLYSNDLEVRISQEIILGVGGVRMLRRLGYNPSLWHMNEGHSAFLTLERVRELIKKGSTFEEAAASVRSSNIFTTHTPVAAGNDHFPLWLIDKYFSGFWKELGITRDQFIEIGRQTQSWGDTFSMPVLALHLSDHANAVSELHGEVARKMWNFLWPEKETDEVPIESITNGVHVGFWLARRMGLLFERYFGVDWYEHLDEPELWAQVENIPDLELWDVRRHLKRKLINYAIESARNHWQSGKWHASQVIADGVMLDQYSLTIGFARRFAAYKRANLIFSDYDRLLKLVTNHDMPVQIIFAGKAHPADEPGKLLIQQVYRAAKDCRFCGRVVFLENYDLNIAHLLVQGVDVWMNTPRRPNEASGTSGMKAALNGTLNFSVLDGWWREGYNGSNGWAIGGDKDYDDPNEQDEKDAASLYDTLENEIIPMYYQTRSMGDASLEWIGKIKENIRTLAWQFSTRRMLKEYLQKMYIPAMKDSE
ncbi:MAG: alpha-glucan family phosphorylase [Anaerolineaceae bacterium]|nr:alpha-glucan family phosphorylase [Anaerolineaceae bacterium]